MDAVLFQAGGIISQMLQNMQSMGFFLYLFPFLLALAITYGAMHFAFGERLEKSARGLISIIIGFFVMLYSSWNVWIVEFFANYLGSSIVILTFILIVAIMLGLAGYRIEDLFKSRARWVFILGVIFIAAMVFFGAGAGSLIPIPIWSTDAQLWTALLFIIILVIAMWYLSGGAESKSGGNAGAAGGPPPGK
jgi:hypothetical protein